MNIVLWIFQILLAAQFAWHGWFYLFPPAEMIDQFPIAPWFRIFIGIAEWLAVVGLILPGVTRIQPRLVAVAATGLAIVTAGATVFHLVRDEASYAGITVILFVLSTLVAYMRWKMKPITPRAPQAAATGQGVGTSL